MHIESKLPHVGTTNFTVMSAVYRNLPFDTMKDFAPISLLSKRPQVLIATPSFPPKTIRELVSYAKANEGKVTFGSAGNGSINQMGLELIKLVRDERPKLPILIFSMHQEEQYAVRAIRAGGVSVLLGCLLWTCVNP